jgi:GNAT superfamily N-acetyltransferase
MSKLAPGAPVSLVPFEPRFERECKELIEALPEWFGLPESNASYLRNLAELPSWLALNEGEVVGAATLEEHFPGSFEIHFMAVRPDFHRRGIGRLLVERLEDEARIGNGRWLHVKTLAPSHPDPFYARTRAFYLALGFAPLFQSSEIWGPENPAVILVKTLTR